MAQITAGGLASVIWLEGQQVVLSLFFLPLEQVGLLFRRRIRFDSTQ